MANKQQIKNEITTVYSEYMGCKVDGVRGLSAMSKDQLVTELAEVKRALRFKKYADKIKVDRLQGYFAAPGTLVHAQFIRVQLLTALANKLWHKMPYSVAKAEARKQVL